LLEPVLIQNATLNGFVSRFDTEFISFHEETQEGAVYVIVKDLLTQRNYNIRCKYLFGADGARSNILRQLELPLMKGEASGGSAWNVLVKADLSKYMENRRGSLHWIYQHDVDHPEFAWIGFPRVVDQWDKWLIIFFPVAGYQPEKHSPPSKEDWMKRVKQFIGDDSIPVEILDTARWQINNTVAQKYSSGRVFCLGDAVHRHPPANGLGSNTCIQDAFNLAWKIAYVLKGEAS
jgi:2-polyprenyl-6-methoxyphenol hydroxylase-like FAD-dependent oxidoreductase